MVDCLSESAQQAQHAQQLQARAGASDSRDSEVGLVANTRSFIESFALPDCERMAADALSWGFGRGTSPSNLYSSPYESSFQSSAAYPGAASPPNMPSMANSNFSTSDSTFHDAQSMMGSMRTTFNSFVSSTAASLGSGQRVVSQHSATSPSCWGHPQSQTQSQLQSQGQVSRNGEGPSSRAGPGGGPTGWELTANCGEASLVLWYPEGDTEEPDQASVYICILVRLLHRLSPC